MFVDTADIIIKSGKGGNGAVSFRREPFVPDGGPDGGDGGNGGNVIFRADSRLKTLMDFKYKKKYQAENGEDGMKKNRFGKKGADLIIKVPEGTLVVEKKSGLTMCDLEKDNDEFLAAIGGRGGRGNTKFKNSVRQAPNFGEAGGFPQELEVSLELKMIADVGLIGFPNVGKSTLLAASTKAKPKIANYHFTTLNPNLGVVSVGDTSFIMADIPGLIEGAHEGAGLGLDFLRHIERTRILIHVVDLAGSEGRDPLDDFKKINEELKKYKNELSDKLQIVAANKTDLLTDSDEKFLAFKKAINKEGYPVYMISAATNYGVQELMNAIAYELTHIEKPVSTESDKYYQVKAVSEDEEYKKIFIEKEEDAFNLKGLQLKKIFNSTNFNDIGSIRYLYKHLEKNGVIDEMKALGLEEGDTVKIFDFEFEYYDEKY